MDYICSKCPVCGSDDLIQKQNFIIDGNKFYLYCCSSCNEEISSKAIFDKKQAADKAKSQKLAEKKEANMPISNATEIYDNNVSKLIELSCINGEYQSAGTGFVISKSGYVITNSHVVLEMPKEDNKIANLSERIIGNVHGKKVLYELDFVSADIQNDIALLKLTDADIDPVAMSFDDVLTGEKIFAIGNSKGEGMCILEGIVSDKSRKIGSTEYIMFSAPVTQGNSGGPVFNVTGEAIGMVTRGRYDTPAMNYAVPSSTILAFISAVEEKENLIIID